MTTFRTQAEKAAGHYDEVHASDLHIDLCEAFLSGVEWAISYITEREPTDAELVDLWWTSCKGGWAVPEDVMVEFGRAVLARASQRDQEKLDD